MKRRGRGELRGPQSKELFSSAAFSALRVLCVKIGAAEFPPIDNVEICLLKPDAVNELNELIANWHVG